MDERIRNRGQGKNKQASMLAMVKGKIDNLNRIEDMLSSYSVLYLYDVAANPEPGLKTDYLLVNHLDDRVLQLGMVKSDKKKVQKYHCNSFMVDYKENDDYDLHYRNLTQCYEISKIVREDKVTKRSEVIYQSKYMWNGSLYIDGETLYAASHDGKLFKIGMRNFEIESSIKNVHKKMFDCAGIYEGMLVTVSYPCSEITFWNKDTLEKMKVFNIPLKLSGHTYIENNFMYIASRNILGIDKIKLNE